MLSTITFQTQGEWETSTVTHMGEQIDCMAIKLHLQSNTYLDGLPGGVTEGVEILQASILVPNGPSAIDQINRLIDQGMLDDAYSYCSEMDIFPGEISILNPNVQELRVVFGDPYLVTNNIRVFLEGIEITQDICEILCEINYIENVVECSVIYTTDRGIFSHNNEQVQIL
jgi:hypothetical protein